MAKLIDSVFRHDVEDLRKLITQGVQPDSDIDDDGRTALIHASIDGNADLVQILVEAGSNVNAQDSLGNSALHYAAQEQKCEVALLLLQAGANVNMTDSYGNTPLWRAVFSTGEQGNMIKLLLLYGADRDRRNKRGKTPFELANTIANYNVAQFF